MSARAANLSGIIFAVLFTAGLPTTTLARRAGLMPRWLAVLSYPMAAFLLVTTTTQPAASLVYPAWVPLVSLALFGSARARPGGPAEGASRGRRPSPARFGRGSHDHTTWCPPIR